MTPSQTGTPNVNSHWNPACDCQPLTRRQVLAGAAAGFGSLALAGLLADESRADERANPLAPRPPHFAPKARRVIFLFMHGGPSQVDTFDYKPLLARDHGQPLPFDKPRVVSSQTGNLLQSPWSFKQYGQSGAWVSELFPHVAGVVDELCLIRSMHGSNSRHGGALLELHTGSDTFVRPSMGSWITYGLGTENQDLPGFITVCPTLTHGAENNYSSAFFASRLSRHAAGKRQHAGRARQNPVHRKRKHVTRLAAARARFAPLDGAGTPGRNWCRSGARGTHRFVRAGVSHAVGGRRACKTSRMKRPPRSPLMASTIPRRATSAGNA